MGECGCGEIYNTRDIKSIGDKVLVTEAHQGCCYCQYGIGVSIYLFSQEEAALYGFEPDGEFELDNGYSTSLNIGMLEVEDLVEVSKSMIGVDAYDTIGDWLEDNGLELMQRALFLGQKKRLTKSENGLTL